MSRLAFDIPDELALQLGPDERRAGAEVRTMAAVKLYELGRLSAGAAADLAGIPKPLFLVKLQDYSIPNFDATEVELAGDLSRA